MRATDLLTIHIAERGMLIDRITDVATRDDRILAAALTSSFARGETDALSDLDIVVVVDDASIDAFVPARRAEVERIARVAWCQEVVGNAPPAGSYLGVGFEGTAYPICTDWYWQPAQHAALPTPCVPLVEKRPVSRTELATMSAIVMDGRPRHQPPLRSADFTPQDPEAARWTFKLAYIWRMSGAAAAMLARGYRADADHVCDGLEAIVADLTGSDPRRQGDGIARVRAILAQAEAIVPRAIEIGAMIPSDRSWVVRTVDVMAALIDEGWSSSRSAGR